MKCYNCPNPDKNLGIFYYLSNITIIVLTSLALQGFFQEKIEESVSGSINDMNRLQNMHNIYPVIRKALSSPEFGYPSDKNLVCPEKTTNKCSITLNNQIRKGATFCCPFGFQCDNIIGFDLENIKSRLSYIGCIQQSSIKDIAPPITSLQAANCVLLLGLIDGVPRYSNPSSTDKEPVIANFKTVEDFFKYKLVDLTGMLAFISLSLVILFNIVDTISSVIPTRNKKYHDSNLTFSFTLSWLFYFSTSIEKQLPFSVLYCFSCLRVSIFSILLTIPSFFAFYSTFEVENYYLSLKDNSCFNDKLFGNNPNGIIFYFSMMRRMKTSLIILLTILIIRAIIFWHACLNYRKYLKAKDDRSFSEQLSVVEAGDLIDADELRVQMSKAKISHQKTKYDTDGESDNETEILNFDINSTYAAGEIAQIKKTVNSSNCGKKESPMENFNVRIETNTFTK